MPRQKSEGGQVRLQLEVAKAPIPARQPVALLRRHVDVGRQQVLARFRAVRNGRLEEVPPGEALADEASLHVDQREDHRVDVVAADRALERVECERRRGGAVGPDGR